MTKTAPEHTGQSKGLSRRQFLGGLATGTVASLFISQFSFLFAEEEITYEVLAAELYPRTPAEEAYLKTIIELMNQGKLPRKLVYASRRYALKRQKTLRLIYFDRCLRQLCSNAKVKTKLPRLK